jgi:hypothetical protein
MQRKITKRCDEMKPDRLGDEDSPAIQSLIEQLNRDLDETRRKDSSLK